MGDTFPDHNPTFYHIGTLDPLAWFLHGYCRVPMSIKSAIKTVTSSVLGNLWVFQTGTRLCAGSTHRFVDPHLSLSGRCWRGAVQSYTQREPRKSLEFRMLV